VSERVQKRLKTRAEYKVFCGFSVFCIFGRTFLCAGCFFLLKVLIEKETVCTIFEFLVRSFFLLAVFPGALNRLLTKTDTNTLNSHFV